MKNSKKKVSKLLTLLLAFGATGCDKTSEPEPVDPTSELNFVAATSTSFDAEVTVGQHSYTFDLALKDDNKLTFDAYCTGKTSSGGGMPGGFPGGGFPGGAGGEETTTEESVETDFTSYNFSYTGSWELDAGYGYILTIGDEKNSVIHTDYNKIQGRHEFYYLVTTSEGSSTVLFQAKDSAFMKTLASDYKSWDERDSTYIFVGQTTGNNSSVALAYLYAHKDGSAVFNTASGANRSVTLGLTWSVENDVFSLVNGLNTYTADNSITKGKGFRLIYNSTTLYCSLDSAIDSLSLTNEDFDGETIYQFTGSYTTTGPDGRTNEVQLNLTNNENKMFLYSGGSLSKSGTYTFENEVFTLTFAGEDSVTVAKGEDGKYTYTFTITVQSFFGTSDIDVTLTYTPEA